MSVGPEPAVPALRGVEGELVSVGISIEPRHLERLLETLARLDFPINPQIYHNAGPQQRPVTLVEFPAWASRLPEIREALRRGGFAGTEASVRSMLEDIRARGLPPDRAAMAGAGAAD